ncbi:MAG: DMT family transporter, partial [Paracoccaceae bacterium]
MKTHHHLMNVLIFLLIGVLWGLNWPAVKFLLTEIKPLSIRAISFTAAAFVLGIATILLKQPLRLKKDEAAATAIVGVFLIGGFNVLTAFGQLFLEASKAAIIAYTMP